MELKDFQQTVLDSLDRYLDELVAEHENCVKIEDLKKDRPDVQIPVPDFTESTWAKLRNAGQLPSARANIAFSPRKDLGSLTVVDVTTKIADKAALSVRELKARGVTIDLPDAIIAATCMVHGLTLVTYNKKHYPFRTLDFHPVPGLL